MEYYTDESLSESGLLDFNYFHDLKEAQYAVLKYISSVDSAIRTAGNGSEIDDFRSSDGLARVWICTQPMSLRNGLSSMDPEHVGGIDVVVFDMEKTVKK